MEGQEEGRRRPRGWSLSQAVNAVGQATLKVSSAIAHTAASAGELLTDKDLRKKGGTKILEKASEGANVVRRSFRTGAQTLARGRREVVERAAAVVRRVGEEMTARRLARALQEERSHGVDVQLGFQVFEEAPHDLRSRLWLVLLESPELARPFQPLRAPPSSAASPGNSEPEGESEGRDAAGSSTALEELLGGRHGEMAVAPAAAHDEAGAAADEEERRQHAAPEAAALEAVPTSALRPAEAGEQDTPAGGEEGGSSGIPDIDEVGAAEAELPGDEAGAVAEQEERGGRAQTGASAGADAEDATAGLQGKGAGLLALEAAGAGGEGDESTGRKALQRPEEEEEAGEQDLVFKPFPAESGAACVSQAAAGGGLPQEGEVWQQAQLRGAEEEQEEEEEDWMVLPDLDEMALVMHRSRRSRGGCSQQASGAGEPRAAASADGASPLPEDAMHSRLRPRVAARRGGGGGGGGGLQGRDSVLELRRAMQDMQTAIFSVPLPIPASYRPDSHFGTLLQMTVGQEDVDDIITRDIHRTFPEHPQFGTDSGRQALFDVLKAYSMQDLEVGYCQGMAFLAGIILMWLPPEPAFRLFSRLLSEPGPDLRRIYLPGLSALKLELAKFEWLLSRHLPRLFAHLQAHAVPSVLYASQWFLTAFCCPFPSSFAARIIDIMLFENNDHIIMQTAVAVMAGLEFELLHMDDFEEVISHIKLEPVRWSLLRQRQIIDAALESPITADELEAADRLISLQQAESALEKGGEAANKRWRQERAERGSSNADGMACESGQPLSSHADEGPGASGEGTGRAFADATGGDEVEQDLWRDMAEMDEEYLAMVRAIGIIWGDGLDPEPEPGQSELEAPVAPDSLQPGERL